MAGLLRLLLVFIALTVRILLKLRLGIPLLYTILMTTVFSQWSAANNALAVGVLVALVAMVVFSWIMTFLRKVRAI